MYPTKAQEEMKDTCPQTTTNSYQRHLVGTWMRARRSMRTSIPARWSDQGLWNKVGNRGETRIKIYKRHKPDRANMKNMSRNKPHDSC